MSTRKPRPCAVEETKQWAEFLDQNFSYQPPNSYAIDFAPLFEPEALKRSCLIWEGTKVICSATLYPIEAILPGKTLKIGIIGAVATDEKYRGQGLSKQVLAEIERAAQMAALDGLILWSDQHEFYNKLGFEAVGRQHLYALKDIPATFSTRQGKVEFRWDWAQVRKMYEAHPMRTQRSDQYWKTLERIKSCRQAQWVNEDGEVTAYLAYDRGQDLHGIIHEWGYKFEKSLHALVWEVLQSRPELLWLTHPALADPIKALLLPASPHIGPLGMFKTLSQNVTSEDLTRLWFWGLDSL